MFIFFFHSQIIKIKYTFKIELDKKKKSVSVLATEYPSFDEDLFHWPPLVHVLRADTAQLNKNK